MFYIVRTIKNSWSHSKVIKPLKNVLMLGSFYLLIIALQAIIGLGPEAKLRSYTYSPKNIIGRRAKITHQRRFLKNNYQNSNKASWEV